MSWVYLVSAGERWRWSFLPVSQLLPCHLFLLHTDRLNCTKKSRHSIALFLLQEENKKKEKTPNCLNATFFYCTKRKEKRQTTDWVITKPTGGVQCKLLETNPLPNSIRGNWQGSKLIGVEVSDPAISQDSPALQSSTLFAIVMIIIIIVVVIVIILILTTVCT